MDDAQSETVYLLLPTLHDEGCGGTNIQDAIVQQLPQASLILLRLSLNKPRTQLDTWPLVEAARPEQAFKCIHKWSIGVMERLEEV